MPNAHQLTRLTDLARDRREVAARKLGRSLSFLRESEARLGMLGQYCADYHTRLAQSAANGVSVEEMRNFREFITRLEAAIGQQRQEVEALQQGVTDCRNGWLAERRRKRAFEVLIERADLTEREADARRLQKLVDEFAGRAASLRTAP